MVDRGLGEVEDSEMSYVGTSDLSSDYESSDDNYVKFKPDVNVGSRLASFLKMLRQLHIRPMLICQFEKGMVFSCMLRAIMLSRYFVHSGHMTLWFFLLRRPINTFERIAKMVSVGQLKPDSRDRNWEDVTLPKIIAFFAILLLMCICQCNLHQLKLNPDRQILTKS